MTSPTTWFFPNIAQATSTTIPRDPTDVSAAVRPSIVAPPAYLVATQKSLSIVY